MRCGKNIALYVDALVIAKFLNHLLTNVVYKERAEHKL